MVNKGAFAGAAIVLCSIAVAVAPVVSKDASKQYNYAAILEGITGAQTTGALDVYWIYIAQLYFTGLIDVQTYNLLYDEYVKRFNLLTGAA